MPVYTLIAFGQVSTFHASNEDKLMRRLYRRTTWTWDDCRAIAQRLRRGVVCIALDYETVVLPGSWEHIEDRPESRPVEEWAPEDRPPWPETPLLLGGL